MRVGRERACADHIQCEVRADEAVMDVNAVLVCVFGPCCALCCSVHEFRVYIIRMVSICDVDCTILGANHPLSGCACATKQAICWMRKAFGAACAPRSPASAAPQRRRRLRSRAQWR